MTFIDWFAGVGGFRKGMEDAGHTCVGFCEYDKYAVMSYTAMHLATDEQLEHLSALPLKERQREILKEEYRNGEWYANDIRRVDAGSIPHSDCWCFGSPCQNFSISGNREGLDGDKSGLLLEIFRLIEETAEEDRPEWLFAENVRGLLSSHRGADFLEILNRLDNLGYDAEWQLINSKYFGVPQNRERVYVIGHLRGHGERKVFPVGECCEKVSELPGYEDMAIGTLTRVDRLDRGGFPVDRAVNALTDEAKNRRGIYHIDRQTDRQI